MFKLLLISVVIVPVVLGMSTATVRSARRGRALLLGLVLIYSSLYLLMLYYLRVRWVGWGAGAG